MVNIDHISDNLKLCEKARWKTPANHADIEPAQQAVLLKEAFRESARQLDGTDSEPLWTVLSNAEMLAATLETVLKNGTPQEATAAFAGIQAACKSCHVKHRN